MASEFKGKHVFDQNNYKNKELFYTIYNNLESVMSEKDSVVMVTSFSPSLKAANTIAYLGLAFSEQQKRVLMIDANMRQPSLHTVFGIQNTFGFAALLSGTISLNEARPTKITEYLYCLPTGQVNFDPSMLFTLESNSSLLAQWKNSFDIVLFHTSNCLISPDAQFIAKHCDAIVLTVQKGRDKKAKISKIKKQFENNKLRITGTILIH